MTSRVTVRRRRWPVVLATALGLLLGAGAASWAVVALLRPPPDVLASPGFTTVVAQRGTVGQSIRLNTSVAWQARSTVNGRASGTVTSVEHADGARVGAGEVLFHVDLRPVVVAQGRTPMFRDLSRGDSGADVAQLQELLIRGNFYQGEASGRFTEGTRWAVQEWQRSVGLARDGVVQASDLLFVPKLPARLALAEAVQVGDDVTAGAQVVRVLKPEPGFTISLTDGQQQLVELGQRVTLTFDGHEWAAVVSSIRPASDAEPPRAVLGPADDGPICQRACVEIPVGEATLVPSTVNVVAETAGVVVPAAAVVTSADGATAVRLADGEVLNVDVVAGAQGSVVVDGLDEGERVRVPGDVE